MRSFTALLAFAAIVGLSPAGYAQSLTTVAPTNGSGGIFLNLTPATVPLSFTAFDTYYTSTSGTAVNVEVWTLAGPYTGFTASSAGWTLSQTVATTSLGSATPAPTTLTTPIDLPLGTSTSVYLHAVTSGGGIRYTGTSAAPPQTTWSNADLQLFSDVSRTGAVAFAGSQFTPRTFSGTVYYAPVPEPASVGLVGAIGLGLYRFRGGRRTARTA